MHALLIASRLVHVILGAFWAGALFFMALFLEPSAREAGPGAAPVMQGLMKRKYGVVMGVAAVLTILEGLTLLWIDSAGFDAAYMGSARGIAYSMGAVLAVIAFLIGSTKVRGAADGMAALGAQMAQLPPDAPRDALLADMGRQRIRMKVGVRWVASLLFVIVALMSVARYLGA